MYHQIYLWKWREKMSIKSLDLDVEPSFSLISMNMVPCCALVSLSPLNTSKMKSRELNQAPSPLSFAKPLCKFRCSLISWKHQIQHRSMEQNRAHTKTWCKFKCSLYWASCYNEHKSEVRYKHLGYVVVDYWASSYNEQKSEELANLLSPRISKHAEAKI